MPATFSVKESYPSVTAKILTFSMARHDFSLSWDPPRSSREADLIKLAGLNYNTLDYLIGKGDPVISESYRIPKQEFEKGWQYAETRVALLERELPEGGLRQKL